MKTERNAAVIKAYQDGVPLQEMQKQFGLTKSRIYQLLRRAGVDGRIPPPSGHDQFVGVNVTDEIKAALREEAKKRGVSVASLSRDAIKEMLVECGYPLEAEKIA